MRNYIVGIILLVCAFLLLWEQGSQQQEWATQKKSADSNASLSFDGQSSSNKTKSVQLIQGSKEVNSSTVFAEIEKQNFSEEKLDSEIENEFSRLVFSNHTGSIRNILLKKNGRLNKGIELPQNRSAFLELSFEDANGVAIKGAIPDPRAFSKEILDGNLTYKWISDQNLNIQRNYWRSNDSKYLINHRITISNLSEIPLGIDRLRLSLGSIRQIPRKYNPFDNASTYLNVGYYNSGPALPEGCSCATCSGRIDGEKDEFVQVNEMGAGGKMNARLLSLGKWACVNNQFFVNLVRPKKDLADLRITGGSFDSDSDQNLGVEGAISFPVGILQPGASKSYDFEIYAGPKDYMGLKELGAEQKKIMQFGIFWWISEPLSWALNVLSDLLWDSYGLGIIVLTIIVKLILWPLTAQATRSQKKMQALQAPMSKLREKHKGNPQKLNQEMMKFYKQHKVNPFAGCWPIMIQIPIFLGMFWMLRSAAELYGQEFLWAIDLSEQDSITSLSGFSINLLPILMVATQWYQMKLNPMQMGPEMSEAQRINAKMMRIMPFMFLVFLYFFSSALVLYWTVQNIMTIFQTLITKKEPIVDEKGKRIESVDLEDDSDLEKPRDSKILSEEEKKYRVLLGIRFKDKLESKDLERRFKERLANYTDHKLSQMAANKRRVAGEKKERLEKAYAFLKDKID